MAQNEDEDPICDAELEMHHQAKRTTSKKKRFMFASYVA